MALCLPLSASIKLAPLFSEGAVLQRDKPVPVWGTAGPGEQITVRFHGQEKKASADAAGKWSVLLDPLSANATPEELVVLGKDQVTVGNILVGDVWLCSGQSNMHWPVSASLNAANERSSANNTLIRYFGIANVAKDTPQTDTTGQWKAASPDTVGEFSAVAYFFARELQPKLGIPVGIIKATPGGSGVEAWISPAGLATLPQNENIQKNWKKTLEDFPARLAAYSQTLEKWKKDSQEAKNSGKEFTEPEPRKLDDPRDRGIPGGLFNANINPLCPYAISGFLWYQGEGNAAGYKDYRTMFPAMIKQWRKDFGQGDLPFLFVQLANFKLPNDATGQQWAFQREAQASALTLPNTGMVSAIDVGQPDDLHPRNKQDVGRRLSLLAREVVYKETIHGRMPLAVGFVPVAGAIRVKLKPSQGIHLKGDHVTDLEVAGEDKEFFPATAKIEGDALIVSSASVPKPKAVRYLWKNAPQACFYSGDGLPVAPFRSDNWP